MRLACRSCQRNATVRAWLDAQAVTEPPGATNGAEDDSGVGRESKRDERG